MNKFITILIILIFVISCKKETKNQIDVSAIETTVNVVRFDQKFYAATAETLPDLKKEYPLLFPTQTSDGIWLDRIQDVDEIALFQESNVVFGDFSSEKKEIEDLFKHVKYYYSTFKEPTVFTLISNLGFENRVLYVKEYLFISLDMYLGRNNEVYQDFPVYLSQNFDKSQLSVDIAKAISDTYSIRSNNRQFIDLIVNEGKKMYQLDCFLPTVSDAQKMGYSPEKMDWVEANELPTWKYFMENKLLYSTDADLYKRFVADAPFSKFYIDIDKESPGRIGVWLGWQIVRSYMNNNNVTLHQLLQTDAEEIFKKSKYKPKK